jgi:hypothetical protein
MRDANGRGYLFLGQSGAGKTTTTRIWEKDPRVLILSDDRIILRQLEGKIWMYGTPWHGEAGLAAPDRTELTHLFFLGRGALNQTVPIRVTEAVMRLFACSFVPFYNAPGLDYSLDFLQQVAGAIPCAELRFVPDAGVIEYIRAITV